VTDETTVDYGEDAAPDATENILNTIDALANMVLDAEATIDAAEEALKKAKDRHRDLVEAQLPEALEKARMKSLTTLSNAVVKLEDKVRASIPKDPTNSAKAFKWLRDRHHGALIKTSFEAPFEAGRDPAATALMTFLRLLSTNEKFREYTREAALDCVTDEELETLAPLWSFLQAVSNNPEDRFYLDSGVHSQTLMALVRELLKDGKIDADGMKTLGAHAWKEAVVKRKD